MKQRIILMVFLTITLTASAQYQLRIVPVDKDEAFIKEKLNLQTSFKSNFLCIEYINKLPGLLQTKGYPAASVDSLAADSLGTTIYLYVGEAFRWAYLKADSANQRIMELAGWDRRDLERKKVSFQQVQQLQEKMLDYFDNNGYPFAKVGLDSVQVVNDEILAILAVDKGPIYKIDSIRNQGNARLSPNFLQHYLGIPNGSPFKKDKLQTVSRKLAELPFVQEERPWDMTLLGTGSILNLYLAPKKSSQVNVLVGFLPANEQLANNKLLVTGEATINLKNQLGGGETIGLNWQQVQVKSPRLNIFFQHPYLFNSPFGASFQFDLFKKDSSFVNISLQLGAQYSVASNSTGSVFIQNVRSNLLTVDTIQVKNLRQLPQEADVSAVNLGVNYEWFNTDYRYNPRKGNELLISVSAGTKKIKKNNVIVQLKDDSDPGFDFNRLYDTLELNAYQFRIRGSAAHYFQLTRYSTLKTAVNGGWFQSPNIFRNELFQIGGYKLLRGFDEESIYASQYAVGTVEYRYLLALNSFLFGFIDYGWARNKVATVSVSNTFLGAGLGMAFETKAGIFNISYAAGKRDDAKFNLRQSKIHLGYVNYF